MSIISASTARQTLPAQLDRVEAGEEVAITRHGRVVAVLVHPDKLRSRSAQSVLEDAENLRARLDDARREPLRTQLISGSRAEELVEAVHAERSVR